MTTAVQIVGNYRTQADAEEAAAWQRTQCGMVLVDVYRSKDGYHVGDVYRSYWTVRALMVDDAPGEPCGPIMEDTRRVRLVGSLEQRFLAAPVVA